MLLYVENKAFPYRTFVVRVQPYESIARVRAQILHILYELGREDHQFRLRFKGQYLRDAYSVEDYAIVDNGIIKMVPLSKKNESVADLRSLASSDAPIEKVGVGILPDIKNALEKEVNIFEKREKLIFHFQGLQYLHFLAACLALLTVWRWIGFWRPCIWFVWTLALWAAASIYCPKFTRTVGFVGRQSIYKTEFCVVYGSLALTTMAVAMYFGIEEWTRIANHGCAGWVFIDDCSHQVVYSGLYFAIQSVCLLASAILVWMLLWNMKVEYGDYVEKYLVQNRDIEDVMKAAKSRGTKDKRVAAFELATMAASGDDQKFRIVAEGGLEVLIRLALSKDPSTVEHSVEAIAELLTVPAIQDNFVEMGGVRTLTALLHSRDHRLVYQAATALSYIAADAEENQAAIVADHGLEDLAHAATVDNIACQRLVAGIFLELAFTTETRMQMAAMNTPAVALIGLCQSVDPEVQRFALQTLELLAIESADMICAQDELLRVLLELPSKNIDAKAYLLASKILLYYAEDRQTCESLMDRPNCKKSLFHYARTNDPIVQKVITKMIYCMLEVRELKYRARHLELGEILQYIQDHAADRETWDMADQALQFLNSDEDGILLPTMSTMEKLDRMSIQTKADQVREEMGSRASLSSHASLRSTASRHGSIRGSRSTSSGSMANIKAPLN